MIDVHVRGRGVDNPYVLDAMRTTPREAFVDPADRDRAYDDSPLPIGAGQTISQPFIVALMVSAAEVRPGDTVLEIGAGSGYCAAVLAHIARRVYAIERLPVLGLAAQQRLKQLGYANVELRIGDGASGWPDAGPFDAIIVSAGGPAGLPAVLGRQLRIGGRLVVPVGPDRNNQSLLKIKRRDVDDFTEENLGFVRFVPLVGAQGWPEDGTETPGAEGASQASDA